MWQIASGCFGYPGTWHGRACGGCGPFVQGRRHANSIVQEALKAVLALALWLALAVLVGRLHGTSLTRGPREARAQRTGRPGLSRRQRRSTPQKWMERWRPDRSSLGQRSEGDSQAPDTRVAVT